MSVKLTKGNEKLGRNLIWSWSIPEGETCPGKSDLCSKLCYVGKGFFNMPSVQRSYERNLDDSQLINFTDLMLDEIRAKKAKVVRIHVAGDFYDGEYANKWASVANHRRDVRFFFYTRSWRIRSIRSILDIMSTMTNVSAWYSCDKETGPPINKPSTVRLAYLMSEANDIPQFPVDLVFRDYGVRKTVQKRVNGVLVCPPENGVTHTTCQKCGVCWNPPRHPVAQQTTITTRISLPVIAA